METRLVGQGQLIVYVDGSAESTAVQRAFEEMGKSFRVIYSSSDDTVLPAVEGPFGRVQGYLNICRYLLPKSECSLWSSASS